MYVYIYTIYIYIYQFCWYVEETISLESSTISGSCNLPASSSTWMCWPLEEVVDADIPFRTESSSVSYSMPMVQLWICLLLAVYCNNSLWWYLYKISKWYKVQNLTPNFNSLFSFFLIPRKLFKLFFTSLTKRQLKQHWRSWISIPT